MDRQTDNQVATKRETDGQTDAQLEQKKKNRYTDGQTNDTVQQTNGNQNSRVASLQEKKLSFVKVHRTL